MVAKHEIQHPLRATERAAVPAWGERAASPQTSARYGRLNCGSHAGSLLHLAAKQRDELNVFKVRHLSCHAVDWAANSPNRCKTWEIREVYTSDNAPVSDSNHEQANARLKNGRRRTRIDRQHGALTEAAISKRRHTSPFRSRIRVNAAGRQQPVQPGMTRGFNWQRPPTPRCLRLAFAEAVQMLLAADEELSVGDRW